MSESIEDRRKRLYYRAAHRGMKEADLLVGRFAHAVLPDLSEAELDQFEALMEAQDRDILSWRMGRAPVPPEHDNGVTRRLMAFDLVAGLTGERS